MNKSPPKPQKGQQFTVVQIKTLSSESSPYSVSSFWLQTNQMKRTYRFKRVTKPKKSIQPDDSIHTSEKSITIGARPKSQSQPQPGILSISNPTLSFNELKILPPDFFQIDALDLALKILPPDFFQIDALDLAPRLLGKLLRRDDVILRITEVEAYRPNDSACHGRFGRTPRTAPVFGPGGHAYVYLCYGLHTMLNVVADKEEVGAAVLVRSCEPVCGLETIQQRRGQITEKPVLLTGPGKVCQALGISTEWSNHRLYTPGKFLLPWLYTFKVNGMKVNNKNGHGYQAVSNSWTDQNQKRYSWVRGWASNMPCLTMSMPPGDSPLLVLLG